MECQLVRCMVLFKQHYRNSFALVVDPSDRWCGRPVRLSYSSRPVSVPFHGASSVETPSAPIPASRRYWAIFQQAVNNIVKDLQGQVIGKIKIRQGACTHDESAGPTGRVPHSARGQGCPSRCGKARPFFVHFLFEAVGRG